MAAVGCFKKGQRETGIVKTKLFRRNRFRGLLSTHQLANEEHGHDGNERDGDLDLIGSHPVRLPLSLVAGGRAGLLLMMRHDLPEPLALPH